MDTQPSQPETSTTPGLSPEPAAPNAGSSKKVIQPTADTPKATVNVGSFTPVEEASSTPSALPNEPAVAPAPTAAPATPSAPEPAAPTFAAPPEVEFDAWKPQQSTMPFTTPSSAFIFSLMPAIAAFIFATFAVGTNPWVVIAILLVLSGVATVASIKAYAKDTGSIVLVSMIISVVALGSTVLGGATYTYYYVKFKSLMNNFNSGSSSSSDDYDYDYDSSFDNY